VIRCCSQCDAGRAPVECGLCLPCYQAAIALGYTQAEILSLTREAEQARRANWTGPELDD